jgi:cytochrome c oxidase assembly protein Cox11
VRFTASTSADLPMEISLTPAAVRAKPGEAFRVTVRARNLSGEEITVRVGHRIVPEADARFLALLQCPLFLPTTLGPGETKEFTSEYLVMQDTPDRIKDFAVTYTVGREKGLG